MESVGIVTITDRSGTFGNRLQNFALQETLRGLGFEPLTIRNTPRIGDGSATRAKIEVVRRDGMRAFANKARRALAPPPPLPPPHPRTADRVTGNREFTLRSISEWPVDYEQIADRTRFAESFAFFVAGSDQVWNPRFRYLNHVNFLTFARQEQRIAYAASIGLDALSRHEMRYFRTRLRGMAAISVRELTAAEIVRDLTGRRVPVVLDPTMLLPIERWRSLATVPGDVPSTDHIAKFYLGREDPSRRELVSSFGEAEGLPVTDLNDPESAHYCTSPTDFLGAISRARMVVTDSYHAAVFATLFRVPHVITGRGQMNSRFATLFRMTGIGASDWRSREDLDAALDVDWAAVHSRIDRERDHSLGYLAGALGRG